MKLSGVLYLLYGLCVLMFGSVAYITKGSLISFLAGGGFGLVMMGVGVLTFKEKSYVESAGLLIMLLLNIIFSVRLLKTGNFFPSGFFVLLTTLVITVISLNIRRRAAKLTD